MQMLSDFISVDKAFQRARRLDQDYGAERVDAVSSYVPQQSSRNILEQMADHVLHSNQRAFTWTGPYGSGKSSLALLLCSLVGGGAARDAALERLGLDSDDPLASAFCTKLPWKVFALTGRQSRMMDDVARLLGASKKADVLAVFKRLAQEVLPESGVLLIIDELGKYLEADCASENAYLLQELAEIANRTAKRVVVVGILHQAVDVYASRLPRGVREEWEKVKGRFIDMPLLGSSDEVIELIGRALRAEPHLENKVFSAAVDAVTAACGSRRVAKKSHIRELLAACWPLNPVVSLLLGPISRHKFAQNERSVYSFLASLEPFGFREFVQSHDVTAVYSPADYWDYLCSNFEPSILATADGHRWMTARDAVERTERKGTQAHVRLAKSLALVDLFRMGSGLEATRSVLAAAMLMSEDETQALLNDLLAWKVAISRHHVDAYAVFAGSDFNIDEAVSEAVSKQNGIDPATIESLLSLNPVVARSLYMRLGTLRWFERVILPEESLARWLERKRPDEGMAGTFLLVLPISGQDAAEDALFSRLSAAAMFNTNRTIVLGVPDKCALIRAQLEELQALSVVAKRPELEGDETGRREVAARLTQTREMLIGSLREAFSQSAWQVVGEDRIHRVKRSSDLTVLASDIAENIYRSVPIIRNELINRDYLSSNVVAARKDLMYRMLLNETEKDLGYTGFPPGYALYLSMLTSIRRRDADRLWRFDTAMKADNEEEDIYADFWALTDEFLKDRPMTTVSELYAFWRQAPIGLRFGPMPILALAFYLANRERVALYQNKVFTPSLTTAVIDEWLIDPSRIALRPVVNADKNQDFVKRMTQVLKNYSEVACGQTPLDVARLLVRIFWESPKWAQHSTQYTPQTQLLKQTVLKASDPVKLLFHDLPRIFETEEPEALAERTDRSLAEYLAAMPKMIEQSKRILFGALKADPHDVESIRCRATAIKGITGQMQLEAFIARLEKFKDSPQDMEGFISLACSKPSFLWTDNDIRAAQMKLAEFAFQFRQQEALGNMLGRSTSSRVFSLVLGASDADIKETVELNEAEEQKAKSVAEKIRATLSAEDRSIALAALADAGYSIIKATEK